MEMSLASFVRSFLECVLEEAPSPQQLQLFLEVVRRTDYEKLTKGDFVIPLKAARLREAADPNTPFGNFIHNPTQENVKMLERALAACRLPVREVSVENNILRIQLDRGKVMKRFLPKVAKEGLKFGANTLLRQIPFVLRHYSSQHGGSSLKYVRGVKLANHITRILELCGARVNINDRSRTGMESRDEQFTVVSLEECEPEAAFPVSSEPEPQHSQDQQDPRNAYCCVVNERESGKSLSEANCGGMTEKNSRIGGRPSVASEGQGDASRVSSESLYLICVSRKEDATRENEATYSCVAERRKWPEEEDDDGEKETGKEKTSEHRSIELSQDASLEQKELTSSKVVEFVITDSLKSLRKTNWVYQYFGAVDASTGNPWSGSVKEYCRILTEELRQTSEMRHKEVDSTVWQAFLEEQTQRCLTLQLLMPGHSNRLRVQSSDDPHNTKEAAFMLYNYARLCSILESFEECVHQGAVAPLPPAEDVDFSLLRQDEEWTLVWVFLLRWPEILEDMALGVSSGTKQPKSNQVIRFLYALSHKWSEYYSRHKVLPDGFLPHLLPLMYARLHLLRALHTLMRVCFSVVGVAALPSQM